MPARRVCPHICVVAHDGAAEGAGGLQLVDGELIAPTYWDAVAAEVSEELATAGSLALTDLARRHGLRADLLAGALRSRHGKQARAARAPTNPDRARGRRGSSWYERLRVSGTQWHGRMEGNLLYTEAFLARLSAQLRGARARSATPARCLGRSCRGATLGACGRVRCRRFAAQRARWRCPTC